MIKTKVAFLDQPIRAI